MSLKVKSISHIYRTPRWYFIKYMVILLVLFGVCLYHTQFKQQTTRDVDDYDSVTILNQSITTNSSTITTKSIIIHDSSSMTTPISMFQLQQQQQQQQSQMTSNKDDDNNSPICHKVARYRSSQCQFVKKNCKSPLSGGMINYLKFRFCNFEKLPFFFFLLIALWILLLFYILSDTAEAFFCPALTQISSYLKLSPNVAGVTFLALGNGAPDIASIIAGSLSGSMGFTVGEPIGGGLFVTTCVMAAVTLMSDVHVDGAAFLRDIGTYLASVCFIFIVCMWQKSFQLWHGIVCLVIYFVYVVIVVLGRAYQISKRMAQLRKERKIKRIQNKMEQEVRARWIKQPVLLQLVDHPDSSLSLNNEKHGNQVHGRKRTELDIREIEMINSVHIIDIETECEDSDDDTTHHDDKTTNTRYHTRKGEVNRALWGNLQVQTIHDRRVFRDTLRRHSSAFFFPRVGIVHNQSNSSIVSQSEHSKTSMSASTNTHLTDQTPVASNANDSACSTSYYIPPSGNRAFIIEDHFTVDSKLLTEETKCAADQSENWFMSHLRQFLQWIEWDQKNWVDKCFYILLSPTILARNLTIPQADPENWSKFFAVLFPLFMGPFILFSTGTLNTKLGSRQVFPLWALLVMIGACFSIAIAFTSRRSKPPKYQFLFVFASFASCILWIYIAANELVSVLQSIGVMWQISDGILALTVLAWGNSLGDLVADVTVARQGYPQMAVGAIFGGPCLNLLIGLGLSMTAQCIRSGSFPAIAEPTLVLSFIFLLVSLISALLVTTLNRFKIPKIFGIYLLLVYVCFFVMSILIETGTVFDRV